MTTTSKTNATTKEPPITTIYAKINLVVGFLFVGFCLVLFQKSRAEPLFFPSVILPKLIVLFCYVCFGLACFVFYKLFTMLVYKGIKKLFL